MILALAGAIFRGLAFTQLEGEHLRDARIFSKHLKGMGFETTLYPYPEFAIVDFFHPNLREKIQRLAEQAKIAMPPAYYAKIATAGSIEFKKLPKIVEVVGDIPFPLARADTGYFRRTVSIPPELLVEEFHPHISDTIPTMHFHITGMISPEKLAQFVGNVHKVAGEIVTLKITS